MSKPIGPGDGPEDPEDPGGPVNGQPAPRLHVVLASASSGRLAVLRGAGIEPTVRVSQVDEDAITARLGRADPAEVVRTLAVAKAETVAATLDPVHPAAFVIGADSMLLLDGELVGKPHTPEQTRRRWAAQAGRTGTLLTGQAVSHRRSNRPGWRTVAATARTEVRFGTPSATELDAYIASGEPLGVAGAFTIDGRGGWFVQSIDGDPSCVVGLSLPLLRDMLASLGFVVTDLWNRP